MPPFLFDQSLVSDALKAAFDCSPDQSRRAASRMLLAALYATEGLHYLADTDERAFSKVWVNEGHRSAAISESHLRWATTTAQTALDLCAAVLGRIYELTPLKNKKGPILEEDVHDLAVSHFLSRTTNTEAAHRFATVGTPWQGWFTDLAVDRRYRLLVQVRHPMTHAASMGGVTRGTTSVEQGHGLRQAYIFEGTLESTDLVEARAKIEEARDLATEYVTRFLNDMKALPPR